LIELPLRIESVANKREHWSVRSRRTKAHRLAALAVPVHPLPCVVTLTRVAPRMLDSDNLQSGCKAIRDGIADRLGVADNDPRVRWEYRQTRGKRKEYALRVEITPAMPILAPQTGLEATIPPQARQGMR
jgi:hypothetical protein